MTHHLSEQLPQDLTKPSSNDRLKAGYGALLARSTLVAAVVHAAAFAFWPTWERSLTESENPLEDFLQLEWVNVLETRTLPNDVASSGIQLGAIPDSLPTEVDQFASGGEGPGEVPTLSEAFRERILGRSAPQPTITEPGPDAEQTASVGSNPEGGSIDPERSVASVDFSDLLGESPIDLDRLSSVRPELVMATPAAWVLLRNPVEIEEFIVRSYRRGELDRAANGSVSVALWIDERGRVEWAEISRSSGRSDMDQVALALFSEVAAFRPARDQGVAVPRSVIFSVRFPWY